jgi:regulator of protease activity HflC (stomatin/prohibitin superfamily)
VGNLSPVTSEKIERMRREAEEKGTRMLVGGMKLFFGAVILILLLLTAVKVVDVGSVGVKTQFGEVVGVLHPGLHIVIPVVNDVRFVSTQIEKYEAKASSASKDLQDVQTQLAVNYRLLAADEEVESIYKRFKGNHENRIIQPLVQEVVKAKTAEFTAEELITKRVDVKQKITEDLKLKLSNYGLEVAEVSITDFTFSPEFDDAIEAKVVAEQKLQKEKIDLQIKQVEVQREIAEKNASAIGAVIEAEGKAKARLLQADAEAKAIEKVTSAITDPYIKYYYVDQWNGELPKVLGKEDIIIDLGEVTE